MVVRSGRSSKNPQGTLSKMWKKKQKKKERKNAAIPACKLRPFQPECATFHTVAAAVLEKPNNWERGCSNDGGDWQLVICGRSFSREGI